MNLGVLSLLLANVEIVAKQRRRARAVGAAHRVDAARNSLAPKMMADLCGSGADVVGSVPSAKVQTVEPHPARRDVKKGRHDGAGVGRPIDPFALRQSSDALHYKSVVRPAYEVHHEREVSGCCNGVEQADRRKSRGDEAVS